MKKLSIEVFLLQFLRTFFPLIVLLIFFQPSTTYAIVILDFESATPGILQTEDYFESGFRITVNSHYDIGDPFGDQGFQIDTYDLYSSESTARIDCFGKRFDFLGVEILSADENFSTIRSSSGGNYQIGSDGWLLLNGPEWNDNLWLEFLIAADPIDPAGQQTLVIDNVIFEIPEPSTIVLMGLGLVSLAGFGRKKFKK